MKKVLVNRSSLPMSMLLSHAHCVTPKSPPQHVPCVPQLIQEKIPKLMFNVIFESDELAVIRCILTFNVYTIDKSLNVLLEEPTNEDIIIYHYLHELGFTDERLNISHFETLQRLNFNSLLNLPDEG